MKIKLSELRQIIKSVIKEQNTIKTRFEEAKNEIISYGFKEVSSDSPDGKPTSKLVKDNNTIILRDLTPPAQYDVSKGKPKLTIQVNKNPVKTFSNIDDQEFTTAVIAFSGYKED
jgi:hypothetical protein